MREHIEPDTAPYHAILNAAQKELERLYKADRMLAEEIAHRLRETHRADNSRTSKQLVELLEDDI